MEPTPKIQVRPYEYPDWEAFYEALNANRRHLDMLGITHETPDEQQVHDLFKRKYSGDAPNTTHYGVWLGLPGASQHFAGNVHYKPAPADIPTDLVDPSSDAETWEINYWRNKELFPDGTLAGRDGASEKYMDTAVRGSLDLFRGHHPGANVVAFTREGNLPSENLLTRLGSTAIGSADMRVMPNDSEQKGSYWVVR